MNALTIFTVVLVATFAFFFFRGHLVLKKRQARIADIAREEGKDIREISHVSYHGGLPELPQPQKLTLALAPDALVLVSNRGQKVALPMREFMKLEKFTTKRKHDVKQRSMVLWGPFNNIMFKDQVRHFIVINYRRNGSGDADNHVLIESGTPGERDKVFAEIEKAFRDFRNSGEQTS